MRGSQLPHAKFSLQLVKFSLKYTMESCLECSSLHFGNLVPENITVWVGLCGCQSTQIHKCASSTYSTCAHVTHAIDDIELQ